MGMNCDRKKAITGLEKLRNDLGYGLPDRSNVVMEYLDSLTDAIELMKEQPEIIRCKDCRHYNKNTGACRRRIIHGFAETWFCADGKRKG